MRRRWREPAAIAAEIDRIRSLRLDALRRQWRLVFGRVSPAGLSKDLLGRMMAARLQERAFGGLDRDSLRFLESLAGPGARPSPAQTRDHARSRVSRPAPHRHDPPRWLRPQGTTYPSLSAIARAITGTAWSGPRFFALQAARDGGRPSANRLQLPMMAGVERRAAHDCNGPHAHERVGAGPAP